MKNLFKLNNITEKTVTDDTDSFDIDLSFPEDGFKESPLVEIIKEFKERRSSTKAQYTKKRKKKRRK